MSTTTTIQTDMDNQNKHKIGNTQQNMEPILNKHKWQSQMNRNHTHAYAESKALKETETLRLYACFGIEYFGIEHDNRLRYLKKITSIHPHIYIQASKHSSFKWTFIIIKWKYNRRNNIFIRECNFIALSQNNKSRLLVSGI